MEPNYHNTGYSTDQTRVFRLFRVSVVVVIVIILALIAGMVYQSRKFHVVNTDPAMNNVSSLAPFIKFDFNKPVKSSQSMSVTSNPDIIQSFGVSGKVLTVGLSSMVLNKTYSITLKSVDSTNGESVHNKTFTFTAQDISFADLPKDQQQAILKSQQQRPQTRDSYNYDNIDILTNNGGLTMYQADDVKQALFQYIQKKQLDISDINFSNFQPPVPHPDDPLAPDKSSVDISFSGTNYSAKIVSIDLKTIELYLYNAGQQVYDSGKVNTYNQ